MKVFVIDAAKCNGCHNCQIGCKDEHVDNEWLPYALPQPDVGQFWMKVEEEVHGQVPKVNIAYRCRPCMHCSNPACMKAARDGAVYKRDDGLVILDPIKAKGQKQIVDACPYGVVYWNEELEVPQKCTGCAHLLDAGEVPHCVDLCTTGALRFGEYEDFADEIANAEVLHPEYGTGPQVYYLNLPRYFYAGDVWDPETDECIEGAGVTLESVATGEKWIEATDNLGDFWFRRKDLGTYTVTVEAPGYVSQSMEFTADKSLNLGDFAMKRAV